MKILFIINELGNGGRERRLVQLIRALDSYEGVEMMVALTNEYIEYKDIKETTADIRIMKNGSLITRYHEIRNLVKSFQPDIIHLWIETALFCVAVPMLAKKYGSKYIVGFVADGNSLSILPMYQRLAIKLSFKMADAIISNSRAGLLAKGAPLWKSHVIYNGFDPKRLADITVEGKRRELQINSKYLVMMCGRMESAKDWDSFVSLAELFASTDRDVYFLGVAGRGAMVEHYRDMIAQKELNNIRFITCRSDVMEILAATDVSVLFTNSEEHAEGVSNSIMESMAAGVPVVATAGGGTAEIITSGKDGYIIEPKDVKKAATLLFELLDNEETRKAMGVMASETIRTRFDLSKMAKEYCTLYKNLI